MTSRERLGVLAVITGAVGLRVWSTAVLAPDLRIQEPILDGRYYMNLALRLSQGLGWPPGPHFMTPFYPFLLSLLFRIWPAAPLTVQVFQAVLGIGTLGLLFFAARRDLGRTAAWSLALLYTLYGPILGIESQVLTESVLFFLAAAALLLWPSGRSVAWRDLLFGAVCGLLTIGRGVFALLPVAALVLLWWQSRRPLSGEDSRSRPPAAGGRKGRVRVLRTAALALSGLFLTLLPLAIHQTRATGHLQLLTLNGGLNFYIGNNPMARGIYSEPRIDLEGDDTAVRSASILAGRDLTMEESSRFWTDRALTFLRERPGRAAWLLGRKALLYLSPREIPQLENFHSLEESALPLRLAFVDFRWILPLAVLGIAVAFRPERPRQGRGGTAGTLPWLTLALVGWIATTLFFATGRYRIPFLAGFVGLAGYGAAALVDMIRRRRVRPVALVLPAVILIQLLLPGYPMAKARAYDAYQLGVRLGERGNHAAALESYRQATRIDPSSGEAWHGVGASLVQLGRLPEALDAYREALRFLPESARTHYNLGIVHGRLGNDAAALGELARAASLDPFDPDLRSDYGIALARNGRLPEAVAEFREILRRYPGHSPSLRALAALGAAP